MNETRNEGIEELILRVLPAFKGNPNIVKQLLTMFNKLGIDEPHDLKYIKPEQLIPTLKYVQACKLIEEGKKGKRKDLKILTRSLSGCLHNKKK